MNGDSYITALNVVIYIVPAVMMIVSILTFVASSRQRHEKSAAEQAQIGAKLDSNAQHLADIEIQLSKLVEGFQENKANIAALGADINAMGKRVDALEIRIRNIESDMRTLHHP